MCVCNRPVGLELCSALTHTPHLLWILFLCMSSETLPCTSLFPRHLQHVSFQWGRERKWNGKKWFPAHCGHMAREESSRSGARRPQSGIFVVSFLLAAVWGALQPGLPLHSVALSLCSFLLSLTWLKPEIGPKNNHGRCTFSSPLLVSFPYYLYW